MAKYYGKGHQLQTMRLVVAIDDNHKLKLNQKNTATGLYRFYDANELYRDLKGNKLIVSVSLEPDEDIYQEDYYYKAKSVIVTNIIPIEQHDMWLKLDLCVKAVTHDMANIQYVNLEWADVEKFLLTFPHLTEHFVSPHIELNKEYLTTTFIEEKLSVIYMAQRVAFVFKNISKEYASEFYDCALKKWPHQLQYLPDEYKTYDRCWLSVVRNGTMLQYVPVELIDEELCLVACDRTDHALVYVPVKFKTQQIISLVSEDESNDGFWLDHISEDKKTLELICKAISRNGLAIQLIKRKISQQECDKIKQYIKKDFNYDHNVQLLNKLCVA